MPSPVVRATRVSGGDIHDAYGCTLADGTKVFVKTNPRPSEGMFDAEARGLKWLADASALRVPRVLAATERLLALEWVEPQRGSALADERLGRGLAALHAVVPPGFGLDHDNFIATLPQPNLHRTDQVGGWAGFYRTHRIQPMIDRAGMLLGAKLRARLDRLLDRLPALFSDEEPPARLHGDLWGGNRMTAANDEPVVFDPAVYGGHREMDLAMMKLFGGFSARVFDAYDEVAPPRAGRAGRVAICQLYPLLVHVNLFGAGYVGQVERVVEAYE